MSDVPIDITDGAPRKRRKLARKIPVTVTLTLEQIRKAAELGDGNVSAGVRQALRECLEWDKRMPPTKK